MLCASQIVISLDNWLWYVS